MTDITKDELGAILADVKLMWESLADVARQVPGAAEIVEPRSKLPAVIDMVFEQAGRSVPASEKRACECYANAPQCAEEACRVAGKCQRPSSIDDKRVPDYAETIHGLELELAEVRRDFANYKARSATRASEPFEDWFERQDELFLDRQDKADARMIWEAAGGESASTDREGVRK